jgi:7-carboxy-7-deazaguanine synthase
MFISEIFYSIQGEGALTGVPSVFIRTSGCNLRCNWCDTMYASWSPEGTEMSIGQILDEVARHPAQHCVLTGGEPMIAKGIRDLAQALRAAGKHITIETAATVLPEGIACDLASLSPKLSNSAPDDRLSVGWHEKHEQLRRQPDVIRAWIDQGSYQLKFVVASAGDVTEIQSLLADLQRPVSPHQVLLMPEGITLEKIRGRNETLVELCKRLGYRFCHRLHVELFGHTRGT